jgi:hypothetical protein
MKFEIFRKWLFNLFNANIFYQSYKSNFKFYLNSFELGFENMIKIILKHFWMKNTKIKTQILFIKLLFNMNFLLFLSFYQVESDFKIIYELKFIFKY